MTLGAATLVILYRSQKGSLITVIRRDGGIYMILTFSESSSWIAAQSNVVLNVIGLWLAEAIFSTPGFPVSAHGPHISKKRLFMIPGRRSRISAVLFSCKSALSDPSASRRDRYLQAGLGI